MPVITFIEPDGRHCRIDMPAGQNIMTAAVTGGIDGILAECGGSLVCATCHVYIEAPQRHCLPPPEGAECALLDMVAAERRASSRLSCRLVATEAFDGLVVRVPATQV